MAARYHCLSPPKGIDLCEKHSRNDSRNVFVKCYIMAGQFAFSRGDQGIRGDDLLEGIKSVKNGVNGISGRLVVREPGFTPAKPRQT